MNKISNPIAIGLKTNILISFGVLFVVMMFLMPLIYLYGVPFTKIDGMHKKRYAEYLKNLNVISDLKKDKLSLWFEERRNNAAVLSESRLIINHVNEINQVFQLLAGSGINENLIRVKLMQRVNFNEMYDYLNTFKRKFALYENIHIVDVQSGKIIVSTDINNVGNNVSEEDYFKAAMQTPFLESIAFRYDANSNKVNLIITYLLNYETSDIKTHKAALIMQINTNDMLKPILETDYGLGKTAEVLLVDRQTRIITPLKNLLNAIPLEYKLTDKPSQLAAEGKEGILISTDYNGKEVIAAFRHLRITPAVSYGMIVKVDKEEIFTPLKAMILYVAIFFVCGMLVTLIITYLISASIARPISLLSKTAAAIEKGNLNARAQKTHIKEINILTAAFNNMLDRIEADQKDLETKVIEEMDKRRKHEQILIQQSKLASMGEMIASIAHQWRQPLNVVSILMLDIKDAYEFGELDSQYLNNFLQKARLQLEYMSKTIDDFRNFCKPSKAKMVFNVKDTVKEALSIIIYQLENHNITVNINVFTYEGNDSHFIVLGYPNEFKQVLINIINNAKDAILHKKELLLSSNETYEGAIDVNIYNKQGRIFIEVSDNGGGIDLNIMDKIFDPYFTTKLEENGTGIGLYMTKVIIEDNMNGRIWAENAKNGAMMKIELNAVYT
ncbi:MAG: sensor histidine kinase [Candidatus Magnetoovum sp. WYHC-5]|nr:sensor histidine kinase [Candidatus Magnetoovum sp. WYHC-5]